MRREPKNLGISQISPTKSLTNEGNNYSISIYQDELTGEGIGAATRRLELAFPELSEDWYTIFFERIKEKGIGDSRLLASVNHVLDTCEFPRPNIARFLSFDKRVKLYDYSQLVSMKEYEGRYNHYFKSVRVPGMKKPLWAHVKDIVLYDLELWNKDEKK